MHVGLSTVLAVAVPQPRALTSLSRPVAARPVATDDRNGTTIDWNKLDVSILNLDNRVDRLAALVDTIEYPLLPGTGAPFALHQACRVPAVNATAIGAELPSTGLIYDNIWKEANDRLKRNQMTMGGPLTPGSVGCGISHALAWKRLVDTGLPYGLILEDDTRVFYAHTVQIFEEALRVPSDWNMIQLQACMDVRDPAKEWWATDADGGLVATAKRVKIQLLEGAPNCLGAYLLSRAGAEYLLKNTFPLMVRDGATPS